jgi:hypothetical protein
MSAVIDLTEQKFFRLTVIERAGNYQTPNGRTAAQWLCRCDCGTTKIVRADGLRTGLTKSCGCFQREQVRRSCKTHGHKPKGESPSATYISWNSLKSRCLNPNSKDFKDYGGAGVKVCDRWQGEQGFQNFLEDMGERPEGTSLSRFCDSGDYRPGNVAWHTPKEQGAEKTKKRLLQPQKKKSVEQIAA